MRDYSEYKTAMIAIGIPMIIIGIILAVYGFVNFGSGGFEAAAGNQMIFMGGDIIAVIGFVLVGLAIIRPTSKYYATELSPATKIIGESIGEGLKESGFGSSQTKEIIKVKCPQCGYLESEDADFCSKCGKKI